MWECKYSKEAVDYRLFFLRLLKKIWLLPLSALLGCIVIGGIYYMSKFVWGEGRTYQTEVMYYIDFSEDSMGSQYEYINQYTWGELISTDFFMDFCYDTLSHRFSKEEILASSYAGIESDVRYLYTRNTAHTQADAKALSEALEKAVIAFGESQKEFVSITPVRHIDKDVSNIRLMTACVLGACIGLFVCIVSWLIATLLDTSVYLPATLERRYKRHALGAPSMPEFLPNCKLLLGDKQGIWVVPSDEETSIEGLDLSVNYLPCDNPWVKPETAGMLKDAGCVIVAVKAGAHNGKRLERTLEELGRLGAIVFGFVLLNEDEKLIKRYYKK